MQLDAGEESSVQRSGVVTGATGDKSVSREGTTGVEPDEMYAHRWRGM